MRKTKFLFTLVFFGGLLLFVTSLEAVKFPVVELDLETVQLSQTLPFDIPFYLNVKTDKENKLKKIGVWWEERVLGANTDCKSVNIKKWWDRKKGTERIIIRIDALKPDKNYQFCFRYHWELSSEETEKFKTNVKNKIDCLLKKYAKAEIIKTNDVVNDLVDGFSKLSDEKLDGVNLAFAEDSIFDVNSQKGKDSLENMIKQAELVGKMVQTQLRKKKYIKNFFSVRGELEAELKEFCRNEVLGSISDLDSDKLKGFLPESKIAMGLSALSDDRIAGIVSGFQHIENALGYYQGKEMSAFWKPEECNEQIGNFTTLLTELKSVQLLLIKIKNMENSHDPSSIKKFANENSSQLNDLLNRLEKCQTFVIEMLDYLEKTKRELGKREKRIEEFLNQIEGHVEENVSFVADTTGDFETRAANYISADVGLAWAPLLKEVFPYVGINIYLRPVNKEVPLKLLKSLAGYDNTLEHRFSAMVGVSVTSLEKEGERDNLFGKNALLFGFGYRLTDAVRVSAGSLVFRSIDPNPVITDKKIKFSVFASISLDWNIRETLGGLGKRIGAD